MTKEQHHKQLTEAIYSATRQGRTIIISGDIIGMVTISDDDRHTHAGTPHGTLEQMAKDAAKFLNGETNDGN